MNIFSNLNWNTHVNRANTSLEFIGRNVKTKSPKIREMAYKILVRPQLEYASEVWDPHTKEQTHKIEIVQRRAARWTMKDWNRTTSVISLLHQLDWQTLEDGPSVVRLFYKIVHDSVGVPLPDYLQPNSRPSRYNSMTFRHPY